MTIGPGGKGTKAIATRYPCVDGIIAETTTQVGHKESLEAQGILGVKTTVSSKERAGID